MTTASATATAASVPRAFPAWPIWVTGSFGFLLAGITVTDRFTAFGASGAATVTALLGILLHLVLATTTHLTGDPS